MAAAFRPCRTYGGDPKIATVWAAGRTPDNCWDKKTQADGVAEPTSASDLVGRPGLDPGTLGLKVQVKMSRHNSSRRSKSQKSLVRARGTSLLAMH